MQTQILDSMHRLLVQSITDYAIYLVSLDGIVLNWNPGAERAKGYRAEEIVGQHFSVFYSPLDRSNGAPQRALATALREGRFEGEGWRLRRDGSRFWAHVTLQPVQDDSGTTIGFAKITRDLTDQRKRESQVREQERNFRLLVQGVTDYAIYMLSPEGNVSNWNSGAERAKGYRAAEIVGRHFSCFYMPEDREKGLPEYALSTATKEGKFEGEGWRLRKDGSRFWAHVVIDPIRDETGELIGFAKITRDVTVKKRIEDEVVHLARHDALTGLLNRASFRDFVERELNKGNRCVLLYLDLDRFKPINDTLGHLAGDKVLQVVAERISRQLRKIDVAGRLGGDEFAVLLVDCDDRSASAAGERFIAEIGRPIQLENSSVSVGVSIGMASTGDKVVNLDMLLRNADLALFAAKREQAGSFRWYETGMESALVQRKALEDDLRLALKRNEFFLNYQPIVNASCSRVMGFEALIQWKSPTRGIVSAGNFIPFAEKNGLMLEIGDWVLQTACAEAARWPEKLALSINVSTSQLRSEKLVKRVGEVLASTGLTAARLEIEVTEAGMMGDIAASKVILDDLRSMGLMVALDDFGTGHSSISFIRALPFTRVKIDRSLIEDMGKTKETLSIVRAITGLCTSLGVAVTAEGIETEAQLKLVQEVGCHGLQGYLLGRPTPFPEWNGVRVDRLLAA